MESAAVQPDGPEPAEDSEDDAAPPPIKRRRSPVRQPTQASDATGPARKRTPPEVDELGYPVNEPPKEPITDFSRRNFFSLINYLRVMQKICKNKAHRNLLLVQYKSSNILRKSLKVPQPELRLYTLKLFKNQVPYCGRKWRQGNMRVITAVYLHCRPELRDEWLAGSDVDAAVDDALPLEQALRSLTHWFNVRHYPLRMAAVAASTGGGSGRKAHGGIDDGETTEGHGHMADDLLAGSTIGNIDGHRDFFARELEKLDLSYGFGNQSALEGSVSGDDVSDGNCE